MTCGTLLSSALLKTYTRSYWLNPPLTLSLDDKSRGISEIYLYARQAIEIKFRENGLR